MLNRLRRVMMPTLLALLVLTGCATTQITSTWKAPDFQRPPQKVMVVGIARKEVNRRVFEDTFVSQLQGRGIAAVASYTELPDVHKPDQAALAAVMRKQGADAVLITRLLNTRVRKTYVPGTFDSMPAYYGRWPNYYLFGYETIYTPGYVAEDEYADVETNLYDLKDSKLLWSAASETAIRGSDQQLIKSFIKVMVETMVKQGVLR